MDISSWVGIGVSFFAAVFGSILVRPEWARVDGSYFLSILLSWSLFNAFLLWSLIKDPSGVCPPEAMCFFLGAIVGAFVFYFVGYPVVAVCLFPGFLLAGLFIRLVRERWQPLCWVPAWTATTAATFYLLAMIFLPMDWGMGLIGAIIGLMCGICYSVIATLQRNTRRAPEPP